MSDEWTVPALDKLDPGIEPARYSVLLAAAERAEKTAGGILLPDLMRDREQWRANSYRLVAVAPFAFTYEKDWSAARKPQVGDVVFAGEFPGDEITGRDGRKYRLCEDTQIRAVLERGEGPTSVLDAKLTAADCERINRIIDAAQKEPVNG